MAGHAEASIRHVPCSETQQRFQGCLLGGAVGDALGAAVEFMSREEICERYGARGIIDMAPAYGRIGAITDDTQMALFTAEGLVRAHVRGVLRGMCHPPGVIAKAYQRWLHTQGAANALNEGILDGWLIRQTELHASRAPGSTCLSALSQLNTTGLVAENSSKGCGGVMRVAPVGMMMRTLTRGDPRAEDRCFERAFTLGIDAAAITHGHPTGQLPAGVFAGLIYLVLGGIDLKTATACCCDRLRREDGHAETLAAIEHAVLLAERSPDSADALAALGEGWVAEEALAIGLYAAMSAPSLEEAVILAVNHDGDSDSTGLIAGSLCGARDGLAAIPERWLAPLELREVIADVADDLATAADWALEEGGAESDFYWQRYPGW